MASLRDLVELMKKVLNSSGVFRTISPLLSLCIVNMTFRSIHSSASIRCKSFFFCTRLPVQNILQFLVTAKNNDLHLMNTEEWSSRNVVIYNTDLNKNTRCPKIDTLKWNISLLQRNRYKHVMLHSDLSEWDNWYIPYKMLFCQNV